MLYYFSGSVTLNKNARAHTRTHKSYSRVTHLDFFKKLQWKNETADFLVPYDACFSYKPSTSKLTKLVECKEYNIWLCLSLNLYHENKVLA